MSGACACARHRGDVVSSAALKRARKDWAPVREVAAWAGVSAAIAAFVLLGVATLGGLLPANPYAGPTSKLFNGDLGVHDAARVLMRNVAVLAVHLGACWIGAIITRPYRPAPARWGWLGRLHRPVPAWAARMAMLYALAVTLASVALQTTALGFSMADISAWQQASPWTLTGLLLAHAVPELIGVYLPLGVFLVAVLRDQTGRLTTLTWQSCLYAMPLIVAAAAIETWVTPGLLRAALT